MTIGEKIKLAREIAGLMPIELARLMHWRGVQRVREIEASPNVTMRTLDRIAKALGTTASEIVAIGERSP